MAATRTLLGERGIVLGGEVVEAAETIRYAIEEMTELKLLTTNRRR